MSFSLSKLNIFALFVKKTFKSHGKLFCEGKRFLTTSEKGTIDRNCRLVSKNV